MRDSSVKRTRKTPSRRELIERLSIAIRASQNISDAFDEKVAERLGINRTDLRGLDILNQRGSMTAGQLAEAMHLTSGAITTLLDRLEKAGYARRVRDTDDRRRILVELTPLAEDAASLYDPLFHGSVELLKERTDRELQVMIDFLERGHEMVELELEKLEREEK
jgi:DNA-binding MarR family transcriptional regulator